MSIKQLDVIVVPDFTEKNSRLFEKSVYWLAEKNAEVGYHRAWKPGSIGFIALRDTFR